MPSIISHAVVPLALGLALGPRLVSRPLLIAGMAAAMLPDLDVLGLRFGIAYAHELGHRGASHSLVFALLLGLVSGAAARWLRASRRTAFLFIFMAAASHGLLDMLTTGGLGVALAWPALDERFFFPLRVIEASPLLSLRRFFGPAGAAVVLSELLWIWLPCAVAAVAVWLARRRLM
jgi:inner membrane protein